MKSQEIRDMRVGGTQTDQWKDRDRERKVTIYRLHSLTGQKQFGSAHCKTPQVRQSSNTCPSISPDGVC